MIDKQRKEAHMALTGDLREYNLARLIQMTCEEQRSATILLLRDGAEGSVYISDGQVVHAECGERGGVDALSELLAWAKGEFVVENDVAAPRRTIEMPWKQLLIQAMTGAFEAPGSKANDMDKRNVKPLAALASISGVTGAVSAARDGTVLAKELSTGDGEAEAALTVFVGGAAEQIGDLLKLGRFELGTAAVSPQRVMVLSQSSGYVGLILEERTSPLVVAGAASKFLT